MATLQIKIRKARKDITRVLTRYRLTLPQVMGIPQYDPEEDGRIWRMIEKDYRKGQKKTFAEFYPDLASTRRK